MTRSVLVLDDDEDLRVTLCDVLSSLCNVECISVPDVESMIRSGDRVLRCLLAILDINLGAGLPTGLDAGRWLTEHGFNGRIVLLTGHATSSPLVQRTMHISSAQIIQKPVSAKKLCDLLEATPP